MRRLAAKALVAQDVEFFEGVSNMIEGLLLGKDSSDRAEVLSCLSCREFVDVMMLKLSGYNNRLTEVAVSVLLQLIQANDNRLTVGHEQLKAALLPRVQILGEIFE